MTKFSISFILINLVMIFFQNCGKSFNARSLDSASFSSFSNESYKMALRKASLLLNEKTVSLEQIAKVDGFQTYKNHVKELLNTPEFNNVMRAYHQDYFAMSGTEAGVNYNEPANLAAFLIQNDMDFRQILTSKNCYDDSLNVIPCSAFKDEADQNIYAAGAVTTQAFLVKWRSSFNFNRTEKMLKAFACHGYPDETDEGILPEEIEDRLATFNSTTQTPVCYSCHRTMNPRAALFYAFDFNGNLNFNPTDAEAIKNADGMPSTVSDLLKEGVKSVYKGEEVKTLKEYATKLSNDDKFSDCLGLRLSNFALGREFDEELPKEFHFIFKTVRDNNFNVRDILYDFLISPAYIGQAGL